MAKEHEISTNERIFIIESLKQGLRFDGRKLDQMRTPEITLSKTEYGYVEVKLGKTKLAVRVSCEISKPFTDRPFEGIFTINSEISLMASPFFESGKNSNEEVLISRLIEKAVRRSNALDLESLCIVAGEKVWHIRVDINFLNYDGGLIDASCIGVMTALQHFKKPDVSIKGTEIIIHNTDGRQPVPLSILHVPICVTYSFYNPGDKEENIKGLLNKEIAIMDATMKEEITRDGSLVITMNKNRELIQLSKNGGLPIDGTILLELAKSSFQVTEHLTEQIKKLLKDDEEERYKTMHMELLEVGASR
ncbi:CIC11C00000002730 [Sungouiella intermedia]|uniref:Exosome complex component RRP45 n=1 Tax=Sungouiella intermedia TaxID=45354 RepID=A0A1L0C5P1_9ASCO|nr:CIC11C00000002730 [[Candida] intermedia]